MGMAGRTNRKHGRNKRSLSCKTQRDRTTVNKARRIEKDQRSKQAIHKRIKARADAGKLQRGHARKLRRSNRAA